MTRAEALDHLSQLPTESLEAFALVAETADDQGTWNYLH